MYCSKCGKENPDAASYCYSCGAQLVCSIPDEARPTESTEEYEDSDWQNFVEDRSIAITPRKAAGSREATRTTNLAAGGWRSAGIAAMLGAGVAGLGFFLPWLSINTNILGDIGPSFGGDISGWSLSFKLISFLPEALGNSSGSNHSSSGIPITLAILILLAVMDIVSLLLIPILCAFIGIHGYRMVENPLDSEWSHLQSKHRIKRNAIIAVVPAIIFLLLLQGILGFSLSGSTGSAYSYFGSNGNGNVSLGLGIMGSGYWLSLLGLVGVIVSSALLSPKTSNNVPLGLTYSKPSIFETMPPQLLSLIVMNASGTIGIYYIFSLGFSIIGLFASLAILLFTAFFSMKLWLQERVKQGIFTACLASISICFLLIQFATKQIYLKYSGLVTIAIHFFITLSLIILWAKIIMRQSETEQSEL